MLQASYSTAQPKKIYIRLPLVHPDGVESGIKSDFHRAYFCPKPGKLAIYLGAYAGLFHIRGLFLLAGLDYRGPLWPVLEMDRWQYISRLNTSYLTFIGKQVAGAAYSSSRAVRGEVNMHVVQARRNTDR